jgi:hypothetical protein
MIRAGDLVLAAAVFAGALLSSTAASAANVPTGEWSCYQGPTWSQFSGGVAPAFSPGQALSHMWIFDQRRYATSTRRDSGLYQLRGDEIVGVSGPFQRVPVSVHYVAAGLAGKPTIFISWSTAPALSLACRQTP